MMQKKPVLEIACFNLGSALIAEQAGADRIEFCSNYWEGGITPPERHLKEVKERIRIPVHAMIRCRGGDFIFSEAEVSEMKQSVRLCRELKFEGIVIGALDENSLVDTDICTELMEEAGRMQVVFHRAIDFCANIDAGFEALISLGIKRVLTSGGAADFRQGCETIKRLHQKFGRHITIIAGGGLRSNNFSIALQTGCSEFHSSALTDKSVTADAAEIKRMKKHVV